MARMRNALKALGAVLAIVALCAPLIFWPVEDVRPSALGLQGVTVTVPATVVVATTIPGLETTTTTTEVPPEPVPTSTTTTTTTVGPIDITVAAVGDVLAPPPLLESVRNPDKGFHEFGPVFAAIAPFLQKADYTIGSLEPRLVGPQAGYGAYPKANAPSELAFALRQAGIDLVATADPHSLDFGWEGIVGTLDRLDTAGLAHVGTSRSVTERNTPVIKDIRGVRVAFLNYTASVAQQLPPEEGKDFAVNMLTLDTVAQDALTARSWGADAVIAVLDWGAEYARDPTPEQEALSREILNRGVDAILGCHAHAVQTIGHVFTTYASWWPSHKYVAYSLGSFVTSPEAGSLEGGVIAYLHLEKQGLRTYLTGVSYLPLYIQASPGEKPAKYRVLPVMPGLEPETDVPLTTEDRQRMAQVWEHTRAILYRPDEMIWPLSPSDIGL
jgi:poly-gamma-glutamate synthesis protein (capsule biosynthesis protein)